MLLHLSLEGRGFLLTVGDVCEEGGPQGHGAKDPDSGVVVAVVVVVVVGDLVLALALFLLLLLRDFPIAEVDLGFELALEGLPELCFARKERKRRGKALSL